MNEVVKANAEIVDAIGNSALEAIERASVDMQVATAHKYPRSISRFRETAITLATMDEETAESCLYKRPVGKDKMTGKEVYAEGMSVRMAEIVGASYGNLRVAARIIDQNERQVTAQGVAHDLESNYASTSEVIESTVDKSGKPFSERMRIIVAKSALSKARRDATFQVVPRAIAKPVEHACKELLFGNQISLSKRRERVLSWLNKLNINIKRVWNALNVAKIDDVGLEELETLTGLKTAIQNNEVTLDEAFPELPKQSRFEKGDDLLSDAAKKPEAEAKPEPDKTVA